ncbi:MAG: hypothetical protein QM737_21120 [Ferruginibacter sp.]
MTVTQNLTTEIIEEKLNELAEMDFNEMNSYEKIKSNVRFLMSNIDLYATIIPAGVLLYRCRINNEIDFFKSVSALSYNPNIDSIKKFGRANEPMQSIFYSAFHIPTAIHETLYNYSDYEETQTITVGIWKCILNIPLLDIGGYINGYESENTSVVLSFFNQYFSLLEVNENNTLYKLSAAVANYIYPITGGIIYDSFKRRYLKIINDHTPDEKDLYPNKYIGERKVTIEDYFNSNVAILPNLVNKYLRFCGAERHTFKKIAPFEFKQCEIRKTNNIDEYNNIIW